MQSRPLVHLFSLCFSLLSVMTHASWQPDFAPNGGFEMDGNRDALPDGWEPAVFDSGARTTWDRSVTHTGGGAVRIEDSKHPTDTIWRKNTGRWIQKERRPAKGGVRYTVSGWIKTDLTEGQAQLTLAWFAGKRWLKETSSKGVTGTAGWTREELTVTAPEGADTVAIYLILQAGVGRAWFDDISMAGEGTVPPSNLRPVDISSACNTGFRDDVAGDGKGGWTDQGDNDARRIPLGGQVWRSVPFDVVDPGANNGKSCVVLRGRGRETMPESAEFPVGRTCSTVYFLHGGGWCGSKGTLVGRYTIHYADGKTEDIPLRNGHEIADWWGPGDTVESAAGWRGENAKSAGIGLNIFPWTNPRPAAEIARISMHATGGSPIPFLVAVTTGDGSAILPEEPLRLEFTETDGWYEWAFALDDPTLEEIDLSHLLHTPAGKHGFVTVRGDGHFYFEDGTRARFFGTNIGGRGCCPPRDVADMVAERLSRYGINMLRLHAVDSKWHKFLDTGDGTTRHINPEWLDRYDYFFAQLKSRGIYVYFDLLDYRKFRPGDGVRDADEMDVRWDNSIKGASIFDPRMIELQKEFATQLLTHKNAYTGLRYVDDPALAVQEITNENSLFYLRNPKLMLPSYLDDLRKRWNDWLLRKHVDRDGLAKAWTNAAGACALLPDEDPAAGTVLMPVKHLYADLRDASFVGEKSPARLNALTRFLYELEVAYYDEISKHLRGLGLRCPITGTNQDFSDASNRANAACGFTSRNNYWCHPSVHAKPFMKYRNLAMVNSNIAKVGNPVANVCSSTAVGKPMIVPEFNYPWPIEWRTEALPLMAAYGRLQDWDGLLYFAYSPDKKALSCFGNQSDPVRWGQVPMAALLFLRGDVAVARSTIHVGVSTADTFGTRPMRTSDRYSPYRIFPFISRVRNAYFDTAYTGAADLVVSSGHSASGDYSAARHAIVFADWPHGDDLAVSPPDRGLSARMTLPGLRTTSTDGAYDTLVVADSAPAGAGIIRREGLDVGVTTERFCLFPCASSEKEGGAEWLHRLYLRQATAWGLPRAGAEDEAGRVFRSDTGELTLNCEAGVFTAITPCARVAMGFLGETGEIALGQVTVVCRTPFASLSVVSLDGKPVEDASRLLLTAVARAENTGQATIEKHSAIPERGRIPILVEPVDCELRISSKGALTAFPLTSQGKKVGTLPVGVAQGVSTIRTKDARSPWILLERGGR